MVFRNASLFPLALILFAVSASPAHAALSPLGLSIVPPAQLPPETFTITGARVSALWGEHRQVYGFDLGVIGNKTQTSFGGLAVAGGFNWNQGSAVILGLQAAGVGNINVNKARIVGLQAAAFFNSNQAESTLVGLQVSLGNFSPYTNIYGLQVGVYNRAQHVYGFQLGLINVAQSLHGIQIGLLNFNQTGLFSVSPFINIGF
ncbi:MAG: hypothetical protein NDJ89_09795 [Oligoflexia bacterium]|nr:hypothetical protein [Oligoflexia bacterium]